MLKNKRIEKLENDLRLAIKDIRKLEESMRRVVSINECIADELGWEEIPKWWGAPTAGKAKRSQFSKLQALLEYLEIEFKEAETLKPKFVKSTKK